MMLSDSLLQALSERVASQLGLRVPRERWPDLTRAIDSLGGGWTDLAAPLQRAQIETLASHLAVGETYFFREPAAFAALEDEVLPALIAARRAEGRYVLRLWSAGCCTGEEPYTLAILLDRLIPDLQRWDITILGTDIHPGFLARAEEGVYNEWSFRGVTDAVRQRYFEPVDSGLYAVRPELKRLVRFAYANLADTLDVGSEMDLVLCRHVLMYFDPAQAARALSRLRATLINGAYLVLGSAEIPAAPLAGFERVSLRAAVLYRKHSEIAVRHAPASIARPRVPRSRTARKLDARSLLARAQSLADGGQLIHAEGLCRQAIAADPCDAAVHRLHALVHEELGQLGVAKAALRRALYLDPRCVLAHVALARVCKRLGEADRAARHVAQALALLERHPPADVLPQSDGMSAGRLSAALLAMRAA
jgi:chemotaxis protein methyltransferase CheR